MPLMSLDLKLPWRWYLAHFHHKKTSVPYNWYIAHIHREKDFSSIKLTPLKRTPAEWAKAMAKAKPWKRSKTRTTYVVRVFWYVSTWDPKLTYGKIVTSIMMIGYRAFTRIYIWSKNIQSERATESDNRWQHIDDKRLDPASLSKRRLR